MRILLLSWFARKFDYDAINKQCYLRKYFLDDNTFLILQNILNCSYRSTNEILIIERGNKQNRSQNMYQEISYNVSSSTVFFVFIIIFLNHVMSWALRFYYLPLLYSNNKACKKIDEIKNLQGKRNRNTISKKCVIIARERS